MATAIKDRFDVVPEDLHRVGAHRAPARPGRGWIAFGWALAATAVLVFAGLLGLAQVNKDFAFELPSFSAGDQPAPLPPEDAPVEAEPELDPEIPITVLNGTPTSGLSTTVGDYLVDQGWDGAALGVGSRAGSSADDVETTLVFYNDPANEGAARAMVQTLGVGEIRLSNTYPASPIAVLIGNDFTVPAG